MHVRGVGSVGASEPTQASARASRAPLFELYLAQEILKTHCVAAGIKNFYVGDAGLEPATFRV